jgi:hypothetical protein
MFLHRVCKMRLMRANGCFCFVFGMCIRVSHNQGCNKLVNVLAKCVNTGLLSWTERKILWLNFKQKQTFSGLLPERALSAEIASKVP